MATLKGVRTGTKAGVKRAGADTATDLHAINSAVADKYGLSVSALQAATNDLRKSMPAKDGGTEKGLRSASPVNGVKRAGVATATDLKALNTNTANKYGLSVSALQGAKYDAQKANAAKGGTAGTATGTATGTADSRYSQYGVEDPNSVEARYNKYISQYSDQATGIANQQIEARNQAANKAQNQNYINYMMAQRAMPEQMARLGLSGGATESSLLRQNLNYQNLRGNTEAQRAAEVASINQNLTNTLNNYRMEQERARDTEIANNRNALYERETAAKQQAWENQFRQAEAARAKAEADRSYKLELKKFKQTVSDNTYEKMVNKVNQYGTVKDCNKKINSIGKKIKSLQKELKKAKTAAQKRSIRAQIARQRQWRSLYVARKSYLNGVIAAENRAKN